MEHDYYDDQHPRRRSSSSSSRSSNHRSASGRTRSSASGRSGASGRTSGRAPAARSATSRTRTSSSSQRQRTAPARRTSSGNRSATGSRPQARRSPGQTSQQRSARQRQQEALRSRGNAYRKQPSPNPGISPTIIGAGIVGVVLVALVGWLLFGLLTRFKVTVNGEEVTLDRGSTVQTLLDKEYAKPAAGDLLDVDGKVLTTGAGEVCTATIDGKKANVDSPLAAGNVVTIEDGGDLTEDATVEEQTVKADTSEGDRSFEAYWYGSIHLLSDGEDGIETIKKGKVSGKTVSEITKEPIDAGYRIYTAQPDDKVIALTFDDGPWPDTTDEILDILEEYNAKATFFTIGNQISEVEDAVKRAHDMGCQICTHTWDHAAGTGGGVSLATMSSSEQIDEIEKGYKAIEDALGEEPKHILRAPGGNFYGDLIDNVWDIVDAEIGWDVDTEDWSRPGSDAILKMILSVKPGQVVLMHDGGGDRSQTVEALREAMPQLVEEGYKFVTIDELIAYGMPSSKSDIPTTSDDTDASTSKDKDEDEDKSESSSKTTSSSSTSIDDEEEE